MRDTSLADALESDIANLLNHSAHMLSKVDLDFIEELNENREFALALETLCSALTKPGIRVSGTMLLEVKRLATLMSMFVEPVSEFLEHNAPPV